jgi:hypothetical protein
MTSTSPRLAQCFSPSLRATQQLPSATMWKMIMRAAPGRSMPAISDAVGDT